MKESPWPWVFWAGTLLGLLSVGFQVYPAAGGVAIVALWVVYPIVEAFRSGGAPGGAEPWDGPPP